VSVSFCRYGFGWHSIAMKTYKMTNLVTNCIYMFT